MASYTLRLEKLAAEFHGCATDSHGASRWHDVASCMVKSADGYLVCFSRCMPNLAPGFLESVYANGMCAASDGRRTRASSVRFRLRCTSRKSTRGAFRADAVVESVVLVEYKARRATGPESAKHRRSTTCEDAAWNSHSSSILARRRVQATIMTNDRKLCRDSCFRALVNSAAAFDRAPSCKPCALPVPTP